MTFLTLLVAFLIERFWTGLASVRRWGWLSAYYRWISTVADRTPAANAVVKAVLVLVSVLLLVLIVDGVLSRTTIGFVIFNFLLLLFCLGPQNFYTSVTPESASTDDTVPAPVFDVSYHAVSANQQLFAPFFWFAVLGGFGAVLYRVTEQLPKNDFVRSALAVLDWLPSRLLGFTVGLVSYFVSVFPAWVKQVISRPANNNTMLANCVQLSLAEDKNAIHFQALMDRALIVWLVVLALIVLL